MFNLIKSSRENLSKNRMAIMFMYSLKIAFLVFLLLIYLPFALLGLLFKNYTGNETNISKFIDLLILKN